MMTTEQWYFYDLYFTALAFELGYNENAKLDEIRWPVWKKIKLENIYNDLEKVIKYGYCLLTFWKF